MTQLHPARRNLALIAASFTAWSLMAASNLFPDLLISYFLGNGDYVPTLRQLLGFGFWYALIGLPTALLICFFLGGRALDQASKSACLTPFNAIRAGAEAGLKLGLISLAFTFATGLCTLLDDDSSFSSYAFGHRIIHDGMPTLLGWALEFGRLLSTIVIGVASGFVVWLIIRSARTENRRPSKAH